MKDHLERCVYQFKLHNMHDVSRKFQDLSNNCVFMQVYQAVYNDQKVAIKIFHNESIASEEDDLDSLQRTRDKILGKMEKEVELMASLNHPNIVRLLGFSRMPPAIMIELCSRGHLAKKFQTFREQKVLLGWKTRVRYVRIEMICCLHL